MNDLDSRITVIKEKRALAITSKTNSIAYEFDLDMNPPLELSEVIKIENQYKIEFPAEYRAFITTIANGGFGSNRSLLSLQDSLKYSNNIDYFSKPEKRLNDDFLKIPFPHTFAYCPDRDPYIIKLEKKCDRGEIPQSECDAVYDYLTAGTMTISWAGCGYCDFLVISGAARGQVWNNGDVADLGYMPLSNSFLDWYEEWLD